MDSLVAAVSFETCGRYDVYLVPSAVVAATLQGEHERWLAGIKRGGGGRKPTSMRHIYMDERDDGAAGRGFALRWAQYRNRWERLAQPLPFP